MTRMIPFIITFGLLAISIVLVVYGHHREE